MAECVDRNEAVNKIYDLHYKVDEDGYLWMMCTDVIKTVFGLQAVDVVEVVRCKECKFAHMTVNGQCKYCDIWFSEESAYMPGDYFCASGERKTDG